MDTGLIIQVHVDTNLLHHSLSKINLDFIHQTQQTNQFPICPQSLFLYVISIMLFTHTTSPVSVSSIKIAHHKTTLFIMNMCLTHTHHHSKGYGVNFEHSSAELKLTTCTRAAPSMISILFGASPPAAHDLASLELHAAKHTLHSPVLTVHACGAWHFYVEAWP